MAETTSSGCRQNLASPRVSIKAGGTMNRQTSGLVAALLALSLSACERTPPSRRWRGPRLGPFALIDQNGKSVAIPTSPAVIACLFRLQLLSGCMPDRLAEAWQGSSGDRGERSRAWRAAGADLHYCRSRARHAAGDQAVRRQFHPRMVGLTGTPRKLRKLQKEYGVYFKKMPPATPGEAISSIMSPQSI